MKVCPTCGLVFPEESTFCFLSGDTLQPSEDRLVGTSVDGRFRIERLVAETPWTKVYDARHRLVTGPCVVKIFTSLVGDDAGDRFAEALKKARRCTHGNVSAPIGGGVTAEGSSYVVHRKLDGLSLMASLSRGPLSPPRAMGIASQVLKGLARIHDFGALHGGVRPSNILVSPSGHVDLVDVGLGRTLALDPWEDDPRLLTAQQYLGHELSTTQRATAPADLYALGVVVYQMLTGALPFEADDVRELRAALSGPPIDLAAQLARVPPPLVEWLSRMLARSPAERPPNAHQALTELGEAQQSAGVGMENDPGPAGHPSEAGELDPGVGRWQRFGGLFTRMVEIGFPNGAPEQTRSGLGMILGRVERLNEIGKKAHYEHGVLRDVLLRADEGRERVADQMNELNVSVEGVRRDVQPLLIAATRHAEKAAEFPERAAVLHREVLRWEGRSGFAEPYQELAAAYRDLAELIERWHAVRAAQLTCEQDAAEKEESVRAVDASLEELCESLRVHEGNLEAEIDTCEQALAALGRDADQLETELLDLASRFTAPLRSKPELGACFRELTQVV